MKEMNILVTLDSNYVKQLNVMLYSLFKSNPDNYFHIFLLNKSIDDNELEETERIIGEKGKLISVKAKDIGLEKAPTTSRYPEEIYYRIFAAKYLPESIDRILYLDPDIIVNGPLNEIYSLPMVDYFFAAASHTGTIITAVNSLRLDMEEDAPYINSGVMLMNLDLLRKEQDFDDVFGFIEKRKGMLILPDQDIISALYGSRIYALDTYRYNMTELLYVLHSPFEKRLNLEWVRKNSAIIHYCGRNKPWKENYIGVLDIFYKEALHRLYNELRRNECENNEKAI